MRKELWYNIQRWKQERTLAHESGHTPPETPNPDQLKMFYPEAPEEEIVLFDPNWVDEVARHNFIYNQSVSTEEDPRLSD